MSGFVKTYTRESILEQLQKEFPELFTDGVLSLQKTAMIIQELKEIDDNLPERHVLVEKKGYITGRRGKFVRLINKLIL